MLMLLAACNLNEHGPWLDESGQPLEGSQVVEYDGFSSCGHAKVTFIRFFGLMFAKDPGGVLGPLSGADDQPLTFELLTEIPAGVQASTITHNDREIFFDPTNREDYLYVHLGDGTLERWPRAEIACDTPGR
jgi:hypothetical protein